MKKLFSLIFFLLLSVNNCSFADGFNSVHTSDGNYIIAVGNNGNLFRSVNGGNTWGYYPESTTNFKSAFTLGNNVWLSVADGKVYKSTKTTTVLTPYTTGVTTSINSIFFLDDNKGYVCGDNGVILKSVNGGIDWSPANTGVASVNLNSINFLDASKGIVVGDNGYVYLTADGGTSWNQETISTSRNILDAKYFTDGIVIVGGWGTLMTKPNGSSWTTVDTKINTDIRGVTGTSVSDVHVCGGGGFIRNNLSGNSEFLNFEKNPMLADLVDIEYFGNTGFAVSSLNNAIIRTNNGGATWTLPAGTSTNITWQSKPSVSGGSLGDNLSPHPYNRNTIFTNLSGRTYVSRDRGENWSQVGTQIPNSNTPHSFFVTPVDTNVWVCAIEASGGDKIVRTTDYGQTWNTSITKNFSNYGEPLQMDQNTPGVFYFGPDNGGFYKSSDNGATFVEISSNYPFRSPCDIMVTWDEPNTILLADGITSSGLADLFKSTDGGVTWSLKYSNVSSSEIPTMSNTQFDKNIAYFTNWPGGNIYKSTNTGESWVLNHTNGFSGWGSGICEEDPDFIVTGSWSGGNTGMSTDGGNTWISNPGLSGNGGVMVLVDRGYVIGQAGSSVYKLNVTYSVTTSVSENIISSIPKDFNLSQNYPNPFNPSTKISYDLPSSGNVVLKVYSELGKEVSTLVNSFKNAGSYEINFNASELSSGIYFYSLQVNGLTNTKKMLLIK